MRELVSAFGVIEFTDELTDYPKHGPLKSLGMAYRLIFGLPFGFLTRPMALGRLRLPASVLAALRTRAGSMGLWQWGQFI